MPAARRAMASLRGALRFVGSEPPYSKLRFAKPVAPSGSPALPATVYPRPSPAPKRPAMYSRLAPSRASLSAKFMTPAMASEPYCAAAPSLSTSTCLRAIAGIAEMSGPWDPNATPFPPCQSMIDDRWRRLPLTRTSVWSGARLRSIAGRTTVEASLMGCVLTLNDGTTVRSCSCRLVAPWRAMFSVDRTSTGTADAVTVRGAARVPTTTVSSVKPASRACISPSVSPRASSSSTSTPSARASCVIASDPVSWACGAAAVIITSVAATAQAVLFQQVAVFKARLLWSVLWRHGA